MPPSLLGSQLQTLERSGSDEADVLRLEIAMPLDEFVAQACAALRCRAARADRKGRRDGPGLVDPNRQEPPP